MQVARSGNLLAGICIVMAEKIVLPTSIEIDKSFSKLKKLKTKYRNSNIYRVFVICYFENCFKREVVNTETKQITNLKICT